MDGVVYAVKITKKRPKRNSRDEKVFLKTGFIGNWYKSSPVKDVLA